MNKVTEEGIKLIHEFEQFREHAYLCPAGVPTIGWGNTFYADGSPVKMGDKITLAQGNRLFEIILKQFENMARKAITSAVNDNQFSAFVSALYNIGHGSSKKSGIIVLKNGQPSTLLKLINTNPNDPKIADEFRKWINKGSTFENGLRRRRETEVKLYYK